MIIIFSKTVYYCYLENMNLEEICKLTHIEPYTSIAASAIIDSGMFLSELSVDLFLVYL